jgi:hypothetical protein
MNSDRPTPFEEHYHRDTTEGPPPEFEDDRAALLPEERETVSLGQHVLCVPRGDGL